MKIFVTGSTGFIGSHFLRQALAAGHKVVGSCRTTSLAPANIHGVDWIVGSLDELLPIHLHGCDVFVHFAAAGVSPQQATRSQLTYWNVEVPLYLLEVASKAGVKRVVLAGSFAEYGRSAELFDLIPPQAPLLPTNHYASSKAACFVSAYGAAIELGLELCYLRIFSAFGDGQFASNFWPALKKAALAGEDFEMTPGEQIRDYIPVEAVAKQFLHAVLRKDVLAGYPYVRNVGTGQPVAMRDFAKKWWCHWEASGTLKIGALPYRSNEIMRFAPLITD
jgi:nucleoside-diphosphate-sugar epimerase